MKVRKTFLLLFILIFPSAFYVYLTAGKRAFFVRLPYYGPKNPLVVNGKKDTAFYFVPGFKFINRDSNEITWSSMHNRIWICCFKHLNDAQLSPSMAVLMNRIESRTDLDTSLRLVTFALDSESVKDLSAYAQMVHAGKRQLFLAGSPSSMNDLATNGFYQLVDSSYKDGFTHFFLVDKEGHIRGIYNGTHVKDIDALLII